MEEATKTCSKCGVAKGVGEFHNSKNCKDGKYPWCKDCRTLYSYKWEIKHAGRRLAQNRLWRKNNRFKSALKGIRANIKNRGLDYCPCTATEDELKSSFTGKCHICGVPEAEMNRLLCVDHDHKTGELRGFLCDKCNKMLGLIGDSEDILIDALHYLMNGARK